MLVKMYKVMLPMPENILWLLFVGESVPEIIARLKRDLIPTFKNGLIYWPLCDFITFKFVPVRLQV
jgi:Mpv17 / PMP22 family